MRWTVCVDGGPKRVNHAACAIGERIYSFGGYCSGEAPARNAPIDVYVLDVNTFRWVRVFGVDPEPRTLKKSASGTVMHDAESTWEPGNYDDVMTMYQPEYDWPYNGLNPDNPELHNEESEFKNVPYMRYGHTVVSHNGKAYLWGGRNDEFGASQKLYEYDPETNSWSAVQVESGIPPARDGHSAVVYGHDMIVFGGFEEEHQRFSQECYAYNFVTREWHELATKGTPPQYRDFHAACVVGDRMYVFGGRCDERGQYHSSADFYDHVLRYLDLKTHEWVEPEVRGALPPGRRSNTMWTHGGMLYMFGGFDSKVDKHYDEVMRFNPSTGEWQHVRPAGVVCPTARRRQCSVMVGDRLFMFGGTMPHPTKRNNALVDLGDLFVLEYGNTLTSICIDTLHLANSLSLAAHFLPPDLK